MPILAFSGSLTRPAPNYGEANGEGIGIYVFDDDAGQLQPIAALGGIDDTSWLTLDAPRRRLYAICEVPGTDQSFVTAFGIDPAGRRLSELNRRPTGGQTACHASLTPDGRYLVVANYNAAVPPGAVDGAGISFPIGADGRLDAPLAQFRHDGSGPNAGRQERSHAHCALPSPDGRFVYVTDLGIDRIVVYAVGADGSLTHRPDNDFRFAPGIGPRHLVFTADGKRLFAVSELIATVFSFAVDTRNGALTQVDSFAIPETGDSIVQPSGIVLTADGRHLFAALRQCNEIIGLAVEAGIGKLSQTGRWPSGGATPRDLIFSPSGRHLLVANQDGDRITTFGVDGGQLRGPTQNLAAGTPMAITLAVF